MKKTIKILLEKMDKLQEQKDGTLQGGFGSVKGGFHATMNATNDSGHCTNTVNCRKETNTGMACTNSGFCFM